MDNLSSYLEKLKLLSNLPTKTNNKFVFQLVLKLCDDITLQQSVLTKLKYFTSFTKRYLSGVHLKPKYFDDIIKIYHEFIANNLCKYTKENNDEDILKGFIVDFHFSSAIKEWEPSEILASDIKLNSDGSVENIGEAGGLYNYEDIIMKSIVGENTIEQYGIDGFLALLIAFVDEKYLIRIRTVEPLFALCSKSLGEKFNNMCDIKIHSIEIKTNYDSHKLILALQPKKKIQDWINLIQSIINISGRFFIKKYIKFC